MTQHTVNRSGSVQDIRNSLQFIDYYTEDDLNRALEDERRRQNRTTVVKLLESALKRIKKKSQ